MQETAFNLGYTRIKKNRKFRKENNNLSIVVSSKRMIEREKIQKNVSSRRERREYSLIRNIVATSLAKRSSRDGYMRAKNFHDT